MYHSKLLRTFLRHKDLLMSLTLGVNPNELVNDSGKKMLLEKLSVPKTSTDVILLKKKEEVSS